MLQWRCGPPPQQPHPPPALPRPVSQAGAVPADPAPDANTENFFASFFEPHFGHFVPAQSMDRTSTSLSFSQS